MQYCLKPQGQCYIRFFLCKVVPGDDSLGGDIAQIKTLCSVVIEAADSNAQEKISFNVVLILLGQYSTGQNHMQCSPRGPRQNYIRKNPDIVFLILLRQHCTG